MRHYNNTMGNTHKWSFSSVGGVKRVNFESGKDILELEHLDQKLWGALSCPVYGLELDSKTLELIDEDKDGQIRASEIIKATKWIGSIIKNTDDLLKEEAKLIRKVVNLSLEQSIVTEDLANGEKSYSTSEVGDWLVNNI